MEKYARISLTTLGAGNGHASTEVSTFLGIILFPNSAKNPCKETPPSPIAVAHKERNISGDGIFFPSSAVAIFENSSLSINTGFGGARFLNGSKARVSLCKRLGSRRCGFLGADVSAGGSVTLGFKDDDSATGCCSKKTVFKRLASRCAAFRFSCFCFICSGVMNVLNARNKPLCQTLC